MAGEQTEDLKKCAACKKTVNRTKRYYRNGRYYCNKNCWNKVKKETTAAAGAEQGQAGE